MSTQDTLPPTDRQMAYARKLALRNQVIVPAEAQADRRALSRWIATQAALRPAPRPDSPSARQVAFAEKLARIKRRSVPDECFRDRTLMSRWIDSNR